MEINTGGFRYMGFNQWKHSNNVDTQTHSTSKVWIFPDPIKTMKNSDKKNLKLFWSWFQSYTFEQQTGKICDGLKVSVIIQSLRILRDRAKLLVSRACSRTNMSHWVWNYIQPVLGYWTYGNLALGLKPIFRVCIVFSVFNVS